MHIFAIFTQCEFPHRSKSYTFVDFACVQGGKKKKHRRTYYRCSRTPPYFLQLQLEQNVAPRAICACVGSLEKMPTQLLENHAGLTYVHNPMRLFNSRTLTSREARLAAHMALILDWCAGALAPFSWNTRKQSSKIWSRKRKRASR